MFGLGKKKEDTSSRGYHAAKEFVEIVDDTVSDEQLQAHWTAVESGHSTEYVEGYEQFFEDGLSRPWWKLW